MSNVNQAYQRSGLFVPTTNVWEVESNDKIDPNLKLLLVRLYQNINTITLALNLKEGGYYVNQPFVTGAQFFPSPSDSTLGTPNYRQISRAVIDCGALPGGAIPNPKLIPHNLEIGPKWTTVKILGSATNPTSVFPARRFIPLPYVGIVAADNIEVSVNQTNVTITSGGTDYSAFTMSYIIIEYITL